MPTKPKQPTKKAGDCPVTQSGHHFWDVVEWAHVKYSGPAPINCESGSATHQRAMRLMCKHCLATMKTDDIPK